MKRLHLLRHAKSDWSDRSLADHDRPLNRRGKRTCEVIARVPASLQTVSNGTLLESRPLEGGLREDHWRLEHRIPSYLVSLIVARIAPLVDTFGKVRLEMNGPPGRADEVRNGYSATKRSLQRLWPRQYGNEPTNWAAASPTPGKFNTASGVEPPSISAQPGDVAASVAGAASIIVSANGGQLTYHWLFHGTNLPGHTTSRLDFANLSTNRSGPYQVIITNIAGAVTSRVAILTVSEAKPDTTRPAVSITSPTAPVTTNELIVATGKASDDIGIGSVFYSVNGGAFLTATGSVSYSVWGTPEPVTLSAGTNILRAYSQDLAEKNSLTNQRSYFLSVRTPLTLVTNGVNANTFRLMWDSESSPRSETSHSPPREGYFNRSPNRLLRNDRDWSVSTPAAW